MKGIFYFLLIVFMAIPCFAVYKLIKVLKTENNDNGARERFLEAIMAEHMKNKQENTNKIPEPAPEELDESIILAKKIAAETFAVKNENTVSENISEKAETVVNKTSEELSEKVSEDENKLTKEQALKMVENMLGSSKKKDAGSELREMMIRLSAEKNKKNN